MMSRILLAWELGGNFGHLSILLPIARHLRQRGHKVLFAVKDPLVAEQFLQDEGLSHVQSPRPCSRNVRSSKPASFADILAGAGFGSIETLAGLVGAWRDLFGVFRPDAVVAQYAPVTQFSARLDGLPCLQLNTGFENPPDAAPYPCFRPNLRLDREHLLAKETSMLLTINRISSGFGQGPFQSLQEIFKSETSLLVTLPELDHYPGRRDGRYIGPISVRDDGVAMQWSQGKKTRIFVYLRPFPGLEHILRTLNRSDAEVIACIPGIDAGFSAASANKLFRIATSGVRLSGILAGMDLAVTHAGHGTTAAAFLAGVPMLMIPTTVEQGMMSRNMECLGVGVGVRRERIAADFPAAMDRIVADHAFHKKAENLVKKYAGYDQARVIERITNTIERLPQWAARQSPTGPEPD